MRFPAFGGLLCFLFLALLVVDMTVFQRVLRPSSRIESRVTSLRSTVVSSLLDSSNGLEFKPLPEWSPEDLASVIEGSGNHRLLRAVAAVISDQRLDGEALSTAFSSPTITTESVVDALIDAASTPRDAENGKKNPGVDRSAVAKASGRWKGSVSVARAQLLWRFESLRFNGGGLPLSSSTATSSGEKNNGSLTPTQVAALPDVDAEALAGDDEMNNPATPVGAESAATNPDAADATSSEESELEQPAAASPSAMEALAELDREDADGGKPFSQQSAGVGTARPTPDSPGEEEGSALSSLKSEPSDLEAPKRVAAPVDSPPLEEGAGLQTSAGAVLEQQGGGSPRCFVYTFVDSAQAAAPPPGHADALALWQERWAQAGWTPVVLGEADAAAHPSYPELSVAFRKLPFAGPSTGAAAAAVPPPGADWESAASAARHASFLRYVAVASAAREQVQKEHSAGGGGSGGEGAGAWLADVDVLPVHLSECTEPPRGGALTLYQEYNPTLVSGSADAFDGFARYVAFDLDWQADPTYVFHGQDVRFFGPPAREQYLPPSSATLADAKEVYPGFHVTEVAVLRHLLSLKASAPVDVAALAGACGTVVPAHQWVFALDTLSNCTYGGLACRDVVANKHKFLLSGGGGGGEGGEEEGEDEDERAESARASFASKVSRGPLAVSFNVRNMLDLRRKVSKAQNLTMFDPRVPDLIRSMEQSAPSNNRTAARWKAVREELTGLASQAHRKSCGTPTQKA